MKERLAQAVAQAIVQMRDADLARIVGGDMGDKLLASEQEVQQLFRLARRLTEHCVNHFERGCLLCGERHHDQVVLTIPDVTTETDHLSSTESLRFRKAQMAFQEYIVTATGWSPGDRWDPDMDQSRHIARLCEGCFVRLVVASVHEIDDDRGSRMTERIDRLTGGVFRRASRQASSASRTPPREALDAYFAEMPGITRFVKIGKSVHAERRLSTLGLRPLLIEPGGAQRERVLHERFAPLRIPPESLPAVIPADGRTEWFSREGALDHYLDVALAS